ncbi:DUF1330 domain-containing protein (plasmid) [Rhizobium ruizarguesonis]|nr:DUF1330 domain-containing protein [Rhizobium ruizarguesonis]TBC25579.1 DUF1330 domain-containing protein [Rhizobium ruizarguesonis]
MFGGRYVGRGGKTITLEGDWRPNRLVIVEFPDMESLMAWYNSPEYAPLLELRKMHYHGPLPLRVSSLRGMTAVGALLPSLSQRYYSKRQYAQGQGEANSANDMSPLPSV